MNAFKTAQQTQCKHTWAHAHGVSGAHGFSSTWCRKCKKTAYEIQRDEETVDTLQNIKDGKYENKLQTGFKVKDRDKRIAMRRAYDAEESRLDALFRADLEIEFGTASYCKRDNLFRKAWDDGHSSGLESVYNIYSELVELIPDKATPNKRAKQLQLVEDRLLALRDGKTVDFFRDVTEVHNQLVALRDMGV